MPVAPCCFKNSSTSEGTNFEPIVFEPCIRKTTAATGVAATSGVVGAGVSAMSGVVGAGVAVARDVVAVGVSAARGMVGAGAGDVGGVGGPSNDLMP